MNIQMLTVGFIFAMGCTNTVSMSTERHRAALRETNGDFTFYAGRGIGEVVARDGTVADDYPGPFMRTRVPAALVDEAAKSVDRVRTLSLEEPGPDIEIVSHSPGVNGGALEHLVFHPGDPWLTGVVQVGTGPDGFTMALFRLIKWNRESGGGMSNLFTQAIYTTGLLPDDEVPTLKYEGDPASWPALPGTWQ